MAHAAIATDAVPGMEAPPPIKVGINGFGRIGRQVVRILVDRYPEVQLRHINSTQPADYSTFLSTTRSMAASPAPSRLSRAR